MLHHILIYGNSGEQEERDSSSWKDWGRQKETGYFQHWQTVNFTLAKEPAHAL